MLYAAYASLCREDISMLGNRLWVKRTFMGRMRTKVYDINPSIPVVIGKTSTSTSKGNQVTKALIFTTTEGKAVNVGSNATPGQREEHLRAINAYLKLQA